MQLVTTESAPPTMQDPRRARAEALEYDVRALCRMIDRMLDVRELVDLTLTQAARLEEQIRSWKDEASIRAVEAGRLRRLARGGDAGGEA